MMERLGRYEIQEELGRGAMGTVYRARDPKIERVVAIKIIALVGADAAEEEEYRQRFFREAQAAGKLSHPGIVTIYDVGEEETTKTPYIVMEYIAGRTLESLVSEKAERLPVETTLDLVKQLAEALDYAHARGIVHRDIKPANIIVTPEGRAKITDFGIAKLSLTQFTVPGKLLGTPAYMAPEQLSGGQVDGRSDLFALGVLFYWMLTGEKPFAAESGTAVMFKIAHHDPVPATRLNPSLRPELDYLAQRALVKDPARRYQTGREFADDLEDARQERPPRSQAGTSLEATAEKTVVVTPPEKTVVLKPAESPPVGKTVVLPSPAPRRPRAWETILGYARRLPRWAYAAIAIAVVLPLLWILSWLLFSPSTSTSPSSEAAQTATLNIRCQHSFRFAALSLWVDDDLTFSGKLTGVVRRRRLVFKTVEGSFSETVKVPAGKRVLRVRVTSTEEKYNQTREVGGEFLPDGAKTLRISFGKKNRELFLALY